MKVTLSSVPFNFATMSLVEKWGHDRNLINGSTAAAQALKLTSEAGEIAEAMLNPENDHLGYDHEMLVDAIGDTAVVATIISAQLGFSLQDAISGYISLSDSNGVDIFEVDENSVNVERRISLLIGRICDNIAKSHVDAVQIFIGDLVMALEALARMNNTTLAECYDVAHNEIKDRKGIMHNGVFVKSDDPRYEALVENHQAASAL